MLCIYIYIIYSNLNATWCRSECATRVYHKMPYTNQCIQNTKPLLNTGDNGDRRCGSSRKCIRKFDWHSSWLDNAVGNTLGHSCNVTSCRISGGSNGVWSLVPARLSTPGMASRVQSLYVACQFGSNRVFTGYGSKPTKTELEDKYWNLPVGDSQNHGHISSHCMTQTIANKRWGWMGSCYCMMLNAKYCAT